MADWVLAERHAGGVRMWDMPARSPSDGGAGPVVMVGAAAAERLLPCRAVPEALMPGEAGGWMFPPLVWDGQQSAGAEARIAGYAQANPQWDGVVCVVGDSTVWAHVSAAEVISFQRFVTGQLAAALKVSDDWNEDDLRTSMADAMARPERLAAYIARAKNAGALWGALLGAELAAAKPYWLGQDVVVIGEGRGTEALVQGLRAQGVPVTRAEDVQMLMDGVAAAVAAHGGIA